MKIQFFRAPSDLRKWLERHHTTTHELWVGYHKMSSGKPSITWSESVDEALCFGWIDGIRKSVDDLSYTNRFTPRRPGSIWSAINIRRAEGLVKQGRMQPAG
ncbi:MAG: YdeI/OmpD-associated family protein, partial [Gammaproteobacteria bacterium]